MTSHDVTAPVTAGDPRPVFVQHDGLTVAALDWGGQGEALVLLHATGFCAGLFDPIARQLTDTFRVVAVDLPGHGGSDVPARPGLARPVIADDVALVLDHLGIHTCSVLGESLGGAVSVYFDQRQPGRARRLILCEAVVFPEPMGRNAGDAMAVAARRRRGIWPNREVAREKYARSPTLEDFAPEALDAYVRWGLHDRDDGQVELACTPEFEAGIYASGPGQVAQAWEHLGALSARASILGGTRSPVPREWLGSQAERTGVAVEEIPGGHLFLHEDTAQAVALIKRLLVD